MKSEASREPGFEGWVKYIWAEGMARKVIVEKDDRTMVRLPLTIVLIGSAIAPWLAAIGVVVAVIVGCRLAIERDPDAEEETALESAAEEALDAASPDAAAEAAPDSNPNPPAG